MFKEDQHTEFKRLWKDEYLRELCAFANADGGTLYVGVEDDGTIVGVKNVSFLLENLPNKIKNKLNFTAIVNRKTEGDIEYIAIEVQPQNNPVLYEGHCFVRSGSTIQELKGQEITAFIKGELKFRIQAIQQTTIKNKQEQSSKKSEEILKETPKVEKPKVDSIEEREHPTLWGKLFKFEELSNDELKSVVAEVCRLIKQGETPTSFVEYSVAVVNLCAIDEVMPIADKDWKSIIANLFKYIVTCPNREELYERKGHFNAAIELVGYKAKGERLQNIIGLFRSRYDWLWKRSKDKMTLFLENMSDDMMVTLSEVYNGTVPDHSTPYNMTGIFQNVDVDKLYAAISQLNNASRKRFINFIEDRYLLRHQLPCNSWVAFDEELPNLRSLKKIVEDNIGQFELNDKRSMQQLGEYIGFAIRRCCGERGVLVRN